MKVKVNGQRQVKRSLMFWVVVIPKEGRRAEPRPPFFWYDTDFLEFFGKVWKCVSWLYIYILFLKSRCHTKRKAGAAPCARPSFGVTTTHDIRDLFAWRRPNYFYTANWHIKCHPILLLIKVSRSNYCDILKQVHYWLLTTKAFWRRLRYHAKNKTPSFCSIIL